MFQVKIVHIQDNTHCPLLLHSTKCGRTEYKLGQCRPNAVGYIATGHELILKSHILQHFVSTADCTLTAQTLFLSCFAQCDELMEGKSQVLTRSLAQMAFHWFTSQTYWVHKAPLHSPN